jgi:WD40 repeat protein
VQLISAGPSEIKLWPLDAANPVPVRVRTSERPLGLAISPDGKQLVIASAKGVVEIAELPSGHLLRRLAAHQEQDILALAHTPRNGFLLTGGKDGLACLWHDADAKAVRCVGENHGAVASLAVSPEGSVFAVGSLRHSVIWRIDSVMPLRISSVTEFSDHSDQISGIVFIDNQTFASASLDGSLLIRTTAASRAPLATLTGHTAAINAIALVPRSKLLATASDDRTIRIWSITERGSAGVLRGHAAAVRSLAISPDGTRAWSGDVEGVILEWDLQRMQLDRRISDPLLATSPQPPARIEPAPAPSVSRPAPKPEEKRATPTQAAPPPSRVPPPPRYDSPVIIPPPSGPEHITKPCDAQPVPPGYTCTCNCGPGRF